MAMIGRIGSETAGFYNSIYRNSTFPQGSAQNPALNRPAPPASQLSPEHSQANGPVNAQASSATSKTDPLLNPKECETCKRRKYQDGSNDPGVSMKAPTAVAPENAASAVIAHEFEHVFREQDAARREGREVVSQSVQIHTSVCPECGRVYVSGGKTTTVSREKTDYKPDDQNRIGKLMDAYA
jgi:hypothetical protein